MKKLNLTRENIIKLLIAFVVSLIIAALNYRSLGKKDTLMLFVASFGLLIALYLLFKDRKKSLLLFIVIFPILVTARKACNFNFLIFKVTYEFIYVSIAFIVSIKDIIRVIKEVFNSKNRLRVNFLIYTLMFLIFALNSSFFSLNVMESLGHGILAVLIPIMFMAVAAANFNVDDIHDITFALVTQSSLSCLYGFFQVAQNRIIPTPGRIAAKRAVITFGYHNINVFAGMLILIMPFLFNQILYGNNSKKEKRFLYIAAFINLGGLFVTFTRGAWLACILTIFILLLSKRYKKLVYAMIALGIILVKPVMTYILHRGATTGSILNNESTIGRIQSIFTSAKIMTVYPFGSGSGTFAEMYRTFILQGYKLMPSDFRSKISVASYALEAAHNLFLQIGTELGLVCLLLFIMILVNRFKAAARVFSEFKVPMAVFVSYVLFSLTTGIEFEHKGIITGTIIIWFIFFLCDLKKVKECKADEEIS